jgi:hypothetical protein
MKEFTYERAASSQEAAARARQTQGAKRRAEVRGLGPSRRAVPDSPSVTAPLLMRPFSFEESHIQRPRLGPIHIQRPRLGQMMSISGIRIKPSLEFYGRRLSFAVRESHG